MTPLPTRATLARGFSGLQVSLTRRGGLAEPRPTPRMPPQPSSVSSSTPRTSTFGRASLVLLGQRLHSLGEELGREVVGGRVHPVPGPVDEGADGLGGLGGRDGVLASRCVAQDGDLRDGAVVGPRLVLLERVVAATEPVGDGTDVLGVVRGQGQRDRRGVAGVPRGDAGCPAYLLERQPVTGSDADHQQLPGLDGAGGGHAEHLARVAPETHAAEHRLERAPVGRCDVLTTRARLEAALRSCGPRRSPPGRCGSWPDCPCGACTSSRRAMLGATAQPRPVAGLR